MDFSDERVFNGARKVKYLFREYSNSTKMVVVLSGFPKTGSPALYNYVRSLEGIKANKLFILDEYGAELPNPAGCYYLGENRDLAVESSVVSLISQIAAQKNISFNDVILCGSSKGGFASIYLGIKYGFGKVIAGGAQVLLGNYLLKESSVTKPVAQYISGGTSSDDLEYMNNLIPAIIEKATRFPELYLHVGNGEPHYKNHFMPLIEMLEKKGVVTANDIGEYDDHSQLVQFYPPYLLNTLNSIINEEVGSTIHLYLDKEKIGSLAHQYVYDDEMNSGREISEGCLLILQDFKYRVKSVEKKSDGFHAKIELSNE